MFREMRRSRQQLSLEAATEILNRNTGGVLAVSGDDGYPYAVPMSYVYAEGKIYFHSAKSGHKIDAIRRSEKASFCVIDQDRVVPEEYTTYFRSVIVFGRIHRVEAEAEKQRVATMLAMKYASDFKEGIPKEIRSSMGNMEILELTVEHMTAKEAIELVKQRNTGSGIC